MPLVSVGLDLLRLEESDLRPQPRPGVASILCAVPLCHQIHGPSGPSEQLSDRHKGNPGLQQPRTCRVTQVVKSDGNIGRLLRSSPAWFNASDVLERIGMMSHDDFVVACDPRLWAAEMTYLERKHPDRWGRRQDDQNMPRVVVQIGVGGSEVRIGVNGGSCAALDSKPLLPE